MTSLLDQAIDQHQKGELAAAEQLYQHLITEQDSVDAKHFLGLLYQQQGEYSQSALWLDRARRQEPTRPDLLTDYGRVLATIKHRTHAKRIFRRAIAAQPGFVPAFTELGNVLLAEGDVLEAEATYRKALDLLPSELPALVNLGLVQTMLGKFPQARASLERALKIAPKDPSAHFNYSLLLLTEGDYRVGFREYGWRRALPGAQRHVIGIPVPFWVGDPLPPGKSLLVTAEQGYGDSLQYVRFLPQLVALGLSVTLRVPNALYPLLEGQFQGVEVITTNEVITERFAAQLGLMDLPRVFGVTLETLSAEPYLTADPIRTTKWRRRFAEKGAGAVVGVVWQGNPDRDLDKLRSTTLDALLPLQALEGVHFVSLQVGTKPIAGAWSDMEDLSADLTDFAETAAAISALKAVVTVDTSVAHLAGALGAPTICLLEKVPDWRYGVTNSRSHWYRTMRLCRQRDVKDWGSAVADAVALLPTIIKA